MPVYEYRGLNTKGKQVKGVEDAETQRALRAALKGKGIFLTEAWEGAAGKPAREEREIDLAQSLQRIKATDISVLTRQMATLVRAGIPLVEALDAMLDQVEKVKLRRILAEVKEQVKEGSAFAEALERHPKVFNRLYVNMVRAGEAAGTLDVVLARLADFTEGQVKLRNKVSSTMAYPAIMLLMGVGIVTFLFIVVIPKVTAILEDLEVALPLTTQIMIGLSDFMGSYWWVLALLIGSGTFFGRRYLRTDKGKANWDRVALKLPLFGGLVRMMAVSRFTKTMATLLSSGVPLLTAMEIVKNVMDNVVLQEVVEQARVAIREGQDIAGPLKRSGQFPPMVTHMIAVGERSGQLEAMLENVSDAYDTQVENRINALTALLEPLMIVGMGMGTAFILFSILLPILKINESIQ